MKIIMLKDPLNHLVTLTTKDGIIEHCILDVPDKSEGYSTDDNARALQLALRLKKDELIPIYLKFLVSARTKEGFHQDLNEDLTWKNDSAAHEGYGRAIAALGEAIVSAPNEEQRKLAGSIFNEEKHLISKANDPRTIAQIIIGLSFLPDAGKDVAPLAERLAEIYQKSADESWMWYEDTLTYDNGRLPMAMFIAYELLGNKKYLEIATQSLDFLIEMSFDHVKEVFSFPGFRGWHKKGSEKAIFGQQPIEAGSMVEACCKAFEVTKDNKYLEFAKKAFAWYSGENITNTSLIDPATSGIYDGIEPGGVNPNEGAESIISYLLAQHALKKLGV